MNKSNDIISTLKAMAKEKNSIDGIIAEYILNCENILGIKTEDISRTCHVSNSTIIRFCKKLGFSGFSEFKYSFSEVMQNRKFSSYSQYNRDPENDNYLEDVTLSLSKTKELFTKEKRDQIVELFSECSYGFIYGIGASYIVAQDLEIRFRRLGKYYTALNDLSMMHFTAKSALKEQLFIGISYSGNAVDTMDSLRLAMQQGARTLLVTSERNKKHEYEKEFDLVIYVSAKDDIYYRINATSRMAMIYVNDLLFFSYCKNMGDKAEEVLSRTTK